MKLTYLSKRLPALLLAAFLLAPPGAGATPLPVPGPLAGLVGNDIDGSGYFHHGNLAIALEVFDLLQTVPPVGLGYRFGFYFRDAPAVLVPIFDVLDTPPPLQSAIINFATGAVVDGDGGILQALFAPSVDPIGFFLQPVGGLTLFSDAALNPGNVDVFGAFPGLADPTNFTLGFFGNLPNLGIAPIQIAAVAPLVRAPEPATAALALPFALLLVRRRRRLPG